MNNEFDDFGNAIDNIEVDRKRNLFKINQLKIEHFHLNSGDIDAGMPISTSVELNCIYNFEKEKLEWIKTISHTYSSLNSSLEYTTDTYDQNIENPNQLIEKLEKYDLRDLKNNYFTEDNPDRFTHWELTYNHYFKIVGTYDQNVTEFEKISDILNFKEIISAENRKVQNKLREFEYIVDVENI